MGEIERDPPQIERNQGTQAPFSLTSSDGSGLILSAMRSNTVIEGPLALTELTLSFQNPEDRTLEGRFAITLPEGASVSRFAMEIGGQWQEGEVVEKQRARTSYESFLHQRKDPALLEQGAGNQFSARVFPIPARGVKHLVLTYAEVLGGSPLKVRLAGLPKLGNLEVLVEQAGKQLVALSEKQFTPTADLEVPTSAQPREVALVHDDLVAIRTTVPDRAAKADPLDGLLLLVDTSAGRILDFEQELSALTALIRALPQGARVTVAGFDQEVSVVFSGPAENFDAENVAALRDRLALGASDFGKALSFARDLAPAVKAKRIIFLSDGVATSGITNAQELAKQAEELARAGVERIDALAIGGIRDSALLTALVSSGERKGIVLELTEDEQVLQHKLQQAPQENLELMVPGAHWQSPKSIAGALPGDEIVVFAKLTSKAAADHIALVVDGDKHVIPITRAASPELLDRAHAVAEIAELELVAKADDQVARRRIISLSTKHRVLSRETAMVVLESEFDYGRFGIDRRATVDILVIKDGQIVTEQGARLDLKNRSGFPRAANRAGNDDFFSPADSGIRFKPDEDAVSARGNAWGRDSGDSVGSGASGLGLSGIGEGGAGRGQGIGLGSIGTLGSGSSRLGPATKPSPQPRISTGALQVNGRLPPEVIQRIVRYNFGRFRMCYEAARAKLPQLAGSVNVAFTISPTGEVTNARLAPSSLPSAETQACVLTSFKMLSFPAPEGGSVNVLMPVHFGVSASGSVVPQAWSDAPPPAAPRAPAPNPASSESSAEDVSTNQYMGRFKTVMAKLAQGDDALLEALQYSAESPSELLAFVAIGEAAEATGRPRLAARAYGSLLDLWSYRVELKRYAGQRIERIGSESALAVAVSAYESAVRDRPDHPSAYRMLAYAQLKQGDPRAAFETIDKALHLQLPPGRYAGVLSLLQKDAALLGAAWLRRDPEQEHIIRAHLKRFNIELEDIPSMRFILSWETDANDVDLHVTDGFSEHAYYGNTKLRSGGELVADVTTGYGPEGYIIYGKPRGFPYELKADYFSRGVMGFGMGKVQVVRHDGLGEITIEEKPFIIQSSRGSVDLGIVEETPSL
jgi:TonB family protein